MNAAHTPVRPPSFIDRVARKKLNAPESWTHFRWQCVGKTNDLLVTGGIPRLLKSGPRKGKKTWDGAGETVSITDAELAADYLVYEAETGNCHKCGGSGQEWIGWSATDGNKYQSCKSCAGTGKATGSAA